jgi:hypothetical protein
VPYVEVSGGAGGTSLRVRDIDSGSRVLIFGGIDASYLAVERTRDLPRIDHISNARTGRPNLGIDPNGGGAGGSFFFR